MYVLGIGMYFLQYQQIGGYLTEFEWAATTAFDTFQNAGLTGPILSFLLPGLAGDLVFGRAQFIQGRAMDRTGSVDSMVCPGATAGRPTADYSSRTRRRRRLLHLPAP